MIVDECEYSSKVSIDGYFKYFLNLPTVSILMFFLLSAFAIHQNQQNCNLIMAQNGQQNQRMTKVIRFLKSQIFNLLEMHINSDVSQKM